MSKNDRLRERVMVKDLFAYQFKTDLAIEQIFERLAGLGTWKWYERANDRWGNYISASPVPSARHCQVKILMEPDDANVLAVNVRFESDDANAREQLEDLRRTLFGRLLPAIGARELTETDDYE